MDVGAARLERPTPQSGANRRQIALHFAVPNPLHSQVRIDRQNRQSERKTRMIEALNRNLFFVKEHVGLLKAANNYDILDPETGQIIMECREEKLGIFTKILRFTDYKRMTPFDIQVRTPDGGQVIRVKRGATFFRSKVKVFDGDDNEVGGFKQKVLSIGGAFDVLDKDEKMVCRLKGKLTGWEFRFLGPNDVELAHVTKKWAGLGKELFSSADNYVLEIHEAVPKDSALRQLILASVMCIDMVLKE